MSTPAQATYNQSGLSGAFDKAKFNDQFHSIHQGDFEACRARAQATPNMTLQVQGATVQGFYRQLYFNNAQSVFAGGSSPMFAAPTTNPRIDLLYLSDSGVLTILQGTEAATPSPPAYPDLSKNYPICEVFLRTTMTIIVNFEDNGANPNEGYIYRDVRPWASMGGAPDASATQKGKVRLSLAPASPTDPIAVGDNDTRLVPAGAIILWDGASCPTGFTRVSALDGRFLVGSATYNAAAGGSNTKDISHTHPAGSYAAASHTHAHDGGGIDCMGWNAPPGGPGSCGTSNAVRGSSFVANNTGASAPGVIGTSGSGGSTALDIRPAYATVLLCKKT